MVLSWGWVPCRLTAQGQQGKRHYQMLNLGIIYELQYYELS
jgi:hypothetical protein